MTKPRSIYSVTQAADKLGCTRQNVLYHLAKGNLAGQFVEPKCWVVFKWSVDKMLEARRDSNK